LARDVERLRDDPRLRTRRKAVQDWIDPVDPGIANKVKRNAEPKSLRDTEMLMTDLEYQMTLLDEIDISDCDWSANVR
jgi:hypothetical protein